MKVNSAITVYGQERVEYNALANNFFNKRGVTGAEISYT